MVLSGLDLAWIWSGFDLDLTWIWSGFDLDLIWMWSGFDLDLTWIWSGCDLDVIWMWSECDLDVTWMWSGCDLNVIWMWSGFEMEIIWNSPGFELDSSRFSQDLRRTGHKIWNECDIRSGYEDFDRDLIRILMRNRCKINKSYVLYIFSTIQLYSRFAYRYSYAKITFL